MRKHWIEYLRVIAIFAVITVHVTSPYFSKFEKIDRLDWWLANILNSASMFAVPVFVMISGAVLLGRNMTISEFYKKRSARLLPPIIFWSLFYIGFRIYEGMSLNGLIYFLKVGLFADGYAYYHLWYLTTYACLMLFAPFINQFLNGNKPTLSDLRALLGVMFIFFILSGASTAAGSLLDIRMAWFKIFPLFIAYFISGYYINKYNASIPAKNGVILLFLASLIIIGASLNYHAASSYGVFKDSLIMGTGGPITFLISALIFLLAKNNAAVLVENRIISTISRASFGMYLIHPVFIYFMSHGLPMYYSNGLTYIPLTIFVTLLASFLSIIFLRKIPFMRKVC